MLLIFVSRLDPVVHPGFKTVNNKLEDYTRSSLISYLLVRSILLRHVFALSREN